MLLFIWLSIELIIDSKYDDSTILKEYDLEKSIGLTFGLTKGIEKLTGTDFYNKNEFLLDAVQTKMTSEYEKPEIEKYKKGNKIWHS